MTLKLNERYPGRFSNPSVDYPQGSFKNRTTPTSKDGSYLEKDWANDKEGFFQSLLSRAVMTANGSVDKVGSAQTFDALLIIGQNQAGRAFATGGTSPAFTLTPAPAITAYAANQRFQVTFGAAGGASPTLNISGLGPKNLRQYNSTGSKIAAVITASQVSDVVYDGTDFVVLDQLPGSSGVTAPQFDNSTLLATTAFVQGVGLQFSSITGVSTSTTLTSAAAGSLYYTSSASAVNITLPAASALPAKATITFCTSGAGATNLLCAGSDVITTTSSTSTLQLLQGRSVTLATNGSNAWTAVDFIPPATTTIDGTARFGTSAEQVAGLLTTVMMNPAGALGLLRSFFPAKTFAANDFIRIPDVAGGLIIQWGTATGVAMNTLRTVTLPTPFPTAFLVPLCSIANSTDVAGVQSAYCQAASLSQINLLIDQSNSSGTNSVSYIAIGQ